VFCRAVSFTVLSPGFHTVQSYFERAIKKYVAGMSVGYTQWTLSTTQHGTDMAGRENAPYWHCTGSFLYLVVIG
jgi:hypothetical protein